MRQEAAAGSDSHATSIPHRFTLFSCFLFSCPSFFPRVTKDRNVQTADGGDICYLSRRRFFPALNNAAPDAVPRTGEMKISLFNGLVGFRGHLLLWRRKGWLVTSAMQPKYFWLHSPILLSKAYVHLSRPKPRGCIVPPHSIVYTKNCKHQFWLLLSIMYQKKRFWIQRRCVKLMIMKNEPYINTKKIPFLCHGLNVNSIHYNYSASHENIKMRLVNNERWF